MSFLLFLPGQDLPEVDINIPYLDKIGHFGMFGLLTFSLGFDYYSRKQVKPNRAQNLYLFGLTLFYAILSEIIQDRFTHRTGDIHDVYADTVGIVCGLIALTYFGVPLYERVLIPYINKL